MKTMYEVSRRETNRSRIRELSVVKETGAFLFVDYGNGRVRRQKKETSWITTFDTMGEAIEYVEANSGRAEQKRKNAILRDAAPELLEALEDMVRLAESAMRYANRDGFEYDVDGELEEPRNLIAKLKGES